MGNENLNTDLIYEFWRWEYLRRNYGYQTYYNFLAVFFNSLGIIGFRYVDSSEFVQNDFRIEDIFETDGKFPSEHYLEIVICLVILIETFKVFPPLSPDQGVSSNELIAMQDIDYKSLPKARYQPSLISAIIKKEDVKLTPPLPAPIVKGNERFLSQNPNFKIQSNNFSASISKFYTDNFHTMGKYEIISKAPERIITKDRKIIVAIETYAKCPSDINARALESALRSRIREDLKIRKKRVKSQNVTRAIGLYLWDQKNENNKSFSELIKSCDIINSWSNGDDTLDDGHLRKIVRQTELCIQKREMLPIS